jgi:hypothetical protein
MSAQVPTINGCQVLPADDVWNTAIDKLPVAANSAAYVNTLNQNNTLLHPDFGATGGYQLAVVPGTQAKVPVQFYYSGDPGPYPIPPNPPIEPGSDHHLFILDKDNCIAYELFNLQLQPSGAWLAGSGQVFPWNSDALHPAGETSADAAGLPMLPGMIRYDEVANGVINHAIRFTGIGTANYYIWPARHFASSLSGSQYPPMGQRFRLKASYDISGFSPHVQTVLAALKKYGMILADNGTSWHVSGLEDSRWNDDEMHALTQVTGNNFEAVDESSLMVNVNSGATRKSSTSSPIPTGYISLVSENSAQCLEVTDNASTDFGITNGTRIEQAPCTGATNQKFQFVAVTGGYKVVNQNSGDVLDVRGGPAATGNAAMIQQWPYWGGSNQIFDISTPDSNGYFNVTALNSGKCLDVVMTTATNNALNPYTPLQQWTCLGGLNQKWKFQ